MRKTQSNGSVHLPVIHAVDRWDDWPQLDSAVSRQTTRPLNWISGEADTESGREESGCTVPRVGRQDNGVIRANTYNQVGQPPLGIAVPIVNGYICESVFCCIIKRYCVCSARAAFGCGHAGMLAYTRVCIQTDAYRCISTYVLNCERIYNLFS